MIGAHYDAVVGSPGADDNASAVAVLFELARLFGKNPPNIRVDLAAYTLEEVGMSGSSVHAKSLKEKGIDVKAMISLEMVGYFSDEPKSQLYPLAIFKLFFPTKGNFITVVSKSGSGSLVKTIKKGMTATTPLPVKSFTAPIRWAGFITRSDHASFWAQGYPAVMITNTAEFRNREYHKAGDIPERLDYKRMAMVAIGVEGAIRKISNTNSYQVAFK
ncbi:MAG: M28 family peptidase [Holophagaceae bacterium]|nr:M28 family peptidase [Holophagaceae bacterium]